MEEAAQKSARRTKGTGTDCYAYLDSPLGSILLGAGEGGLTLINFQAGTGPVTPDPAWREAGEPFREARRQVAAYFAGDLERFDLPLAPEGTLFQRRVWEELRRIPYGQTRSYGQLAHRLGKPGAARAVGAANGRNPLPIVVPCHRVIGSDGSLTGFYGGLFLKKALLALEGGDSPPAGGQLSLCSSSPS